ncbi:MAG: hypothetical protein F4W95_07125 [Chloroflexi bacterium]|nr:hypothetical protein [Chloroflexota bacterium]MYD48242.1 hypothetical protein [Chloroflexota bacterium]
MTSRQCAKCGAPLNVDAATWEQQCADCSVASSLPIKERGKAAAIMIGLVVSVGVYLPIMLLWRVISSYSTGSLPVMETVFFVIVDFAILIGAIALGVKTYRTIRRRRASKE